MTVGENIKRIRKGKGLTQKKLGELCGIAESNIRKYESGKQNPKIETIDKIAHALNVPLAQIKEDISWEEVKKTSIWKDINRKTLAMEGTIAILAYIYGNAEEKTVFDDELGECPYWLIGVNDNKFVLYEGDIERLLKFFTVSAPFFIDSVKDTRPEIEIIKELSSNMQSTPES